MSIELVEGTEVAHKTEGPIGFVLDIDIETGIVYVERYNKVEIEYKISDLTVIPSYQKKLLLHEEIKKEEEDRKKEQRTKKIKVIYESLSDELRNKISAFYKILPYKVSPNLVFEQKLNMLALLIGEKDADSVLEQTYKKRPEIYNKNFYTFLLVNLENLLNLINLIRNKIEIEKQLDKDSLDAEDFSKDSLEEFKEPLKFEEKKFLEYSKLLEKAGIILTEYKDTCKIGMVVNKRGNIVEFKDLKW